MLTWTTEPPTVPGWYWHKNCLGTTIMDLKKLKNVKITRIDGWYWSGPIPEPVDNSKEQPWPN